MELTCERMENVEAEAASEKEKKIEIKAMDEKMAKVETVDEKMAMVVEKMAMTDEKNVLPLEVLKLLIGRPVKRTTVPLGLCSTGRKAASAATETVNVVAANGEAEIEMPVTPVCRRALPPRRFFATLRPRRRTPAASG